MNETQQNIPATLRVTDVCGMKLGHEPRCQLALRRIVGVDVHEINQPRQVSGQLRPSPDWSTRVMTELERLQRRFQVTNRRVSIAANRVHRDPRLSSQLLGSHPKRERERLQHPPVRDRLLSPFDLTEVAPRDPRQLRHLADPELPPGSDLPEPSTKLSIIHRLLLPFLSRC